VCVLIDILNKTKNGTKCRELQWVEVAVEEADAMVADEAEDVEHQEEVEVDQVAEAAAEAGVMAVAAEAAAEADAMVVAAEAVEAVQAA